jgi:hypothetical protein
MKTYLRILLSLTLLFALSGCFELIEDTTIHEDGSGEYKLTLNLSASQTRLNSVMAMDSIDGKKVPSNTDIKKELVEFVNRMNQTDGITNASSNFSMDDWILKFNCSFDSLPALKNAFYQASRKWGKSEKDKQKFDQIELSYEDNTYTRSFSSNIDPKYKQSIKEDDDYGKLSEGKCVFIQRFDQTISTTNHPKVRIAKNKKATMLMISPIEIIQNPEIIDYSVTLNK